MKKEIIVKDENELENSLEVSLILVNTILNNITTKKRHVYAFSVVIEDSELNYDVTIDRKYFSAILLENLPIHEEYEYYEQCSEILKAIDIIENIKMS